MINNWILFFLFLPTVLFSQISNSSYHSLNLQSSSRILSLGGGVIAIIDNDVSLASTTPSLLNPLMDKKVSFNFVDYVSDINFISSHTAKKLSNNLMLFFGLDAVNYGEFNHTNDIGDVISTFSSNQQLITVGLSKYLNKDIILGSNLKFLNSYLETYHSMSISSNISLTYYLKEKDFCATLLLMNIGKPIKSYTSEQENLPFEIQLGFSKSLDHLPFRYSFVLRHLNIYDISNDFSLSTIYDPLTNSLIYKDETIVKKMLRHVILGGELNPFRRSFFLRGGFNFQRREDLRPSSIFSMTGFSYGFGFKIKNIEINYSRNALHSASMINSFSIATNLSNFGL